jgi:hypothetical protein
MFLAVYGVKWGGDVENMSVCTTYGEQRKYICTILFHILQKKRQSVTHSWSWTPLEKVQIVQPLKKFPEFYGTRRFITVFTRALHWSLF